MPVQNVHSQTNIFIDVDGHHPLNPKQFFTTTAPSIDEGGSNRVTPVVADHNVTYFGRTPNISGVQSLQELKKMTSNSMIPDH